MHGATWTVLLRPTGKTPKGAFQKLRMHFVSTMAIGWEAMDQPTEASPNNCLTLSKPIPKPDHPRSKSITWWPAEADGSWKALSSGTLKFRLRSVGGSQQDCTVGICPHSESNLNLENLEAQVRRPHLEEKMQC